MFKWDVIKVKQIMPDSIAKLFVIMLLTTMTETYVFLAAFSEIFAHLGNFVQPKYIK